MPNAAGHSETATARLDDTLLRRAHRLLRVGGWEYVPTPDALRWTADMYRFFELAPDHTPQLTTFVQLCAPSAQPTLRRALMRALDAGTPFNLELPFVTACGHARWGRVLCEPDVTDEAVERLTGTLQDITERKNAEDALRAERELLDTLLNQMHAGVMACDAAGRITAMNRTAQTWLGQRITDTPPDRWAEHDRLFRLDGTTPVPPHEMPLYRALHGETVRAAEMIIAPEDGDRRIVECNGHPLRTEDGTLRGAVVVMHDVTERRALEEQLYRQAHRDVLTGLPNRTRFLQRCEHAIERFQDDRTPYAVLFLDLDRFKSVNDSLGHHAGNALLQAVAERLQHTLRDQDVVARLSGDEFAILLHDVSTEDDAQRVATRIADVLSTPFDLNGNTVHTTASIGIVVGHPRHFLPEDVLREADMAMYRVKLRSEETLVFDPSLGEEVRTQFFLEADLHRALQQDEFAVAYQPIVRLADGALAGFEALVRWQHPERGFLMPKAFIGVAEESGLIADIDRWVLHAACQQTRQWQEQFGAGAVPLLHVNCARQTFLDAALSDYVNDVLDAGQLSPTRLVLEVTERELVEDMDRMRAEMQQFKHQNVRLGIDDFGVKYSSLGVLQQLPIDEIKVDRSFIQRIDGSGANQAIVQTLAELAGRLGLSLVAEGIETPEQLAVLQELGYALGQGHLMGRPLDEAAATACVAGERPWITHWTDAPLPSSGPASTERAAGL